MNGTAVLLTILGGAAIAVQNAVMVALTGRGLALTSTMLVNSIVGISLLLGIEVWRGGPGFASEIIKRIDIWYLAPGLLGSLFVFGSLYGYRNQGAVVTIALIVASQLAVGLALDAAGLKGEATNPISLERLIGLAMLLAGAALVVRKG